MLLVLITYKEVTTIISKVPASDILVLTEREKGFAAQDTDAYAHEASPRMKIVAITELEHELKMFGKDRTNREDDQ